MSRLTRKQLEADIAFLLLRADCAGSCSFTGDRWTGISSNAIVSVAYGGKQGDLPHDRGDYAACVRTVRRLPSHRLTAEVLAALRAARAAYLARYPAHITATSRRAEHKRLDEERAAWKKQHRQRKRR